MATCETQSRLDEVTHGSAGHSAGQQHWAALGGGSIGRRQHWAAAALGGGSIGRRQHWVAAALGGGSIGRRQHWAAALGGSAGPLFVLARVALVRRVFYALALELALALALELALELARLPPCGRDL